MNPFNKSQQKTVLSNFMLSRSKQQRSSPRTGITLSSTNDDICSSSGETLTKHSQKSGLLKSIPSLHSIPSASSMSILSSVTHSKTNAKDDSIRAGVNSKSKTSRQKKLKGSLAHSPKYATLPTPLNGTSVPVKANIKDINVGFEFSVLCMREQAELLDAAADILFEVFKPVAKTPSLTDTELRETVFDFVQTVCSQYLQTEFHSFYHAVDVTQLMYTLLKKYFVNRIDRFNMVCLIVACLCHDVSHPGVNTEFLKAEGLLKGFDSLEKFHIEVTQRLVSTHNLFTKYLDEKQQADLLEKVSNFIDATDMSKDAQVRQRASEKTISEKDKLSVDHLLILMKLSDLANTVRNFDDANKWSYYLALELGAAEAYRKRVSNTDDNTKHDRTGSVDPKYFEESGILSAYGAVRKIQKELIVTRSSELKANLSTSTGSFIDKIVNPIVGVLATFDKAAAEEYSRRLRANRTQWITFNNGR